MRYTTVIQKAAVFIGKRFVQPWYHSDFVFLMSPTGRPLTAYLQEMSQFSNKVISDRREQLKKNSSDNIANAAADHMDMLEILLTVSGEDGEGLSHSDIGEVVETFLFAGQDPTCTTLQWAVHHLSQEQACARTLSLRNSGSFQPNLQHKHLAELQYINWTIKEVLRFNSIVVAVTRSAEKDTIDSITIP
ncbi:cytochrome P450 4F3-like [Sycon ciliatum]|uniref:cytochrome P450 4F3-like n=1 Tax=Sycon ciliatum TaxID=27933 RepID=UPI0020AB2FBD